MYFLFWKVHELESSDQVSEKYNSLTQEKLTLDGRVIQLESMIRQKDEVREARCCMLSEYSMLPGLLKHGYPDVVQWSMFCFCET